MMTYRSELLFGKNSSWNFRICQRKSKELHVARLTGAYKPGMREVMGPLRGTTGPKVRFGTKAAIQVSDTEAYLARKGLSIGHELGDYLSFWTIRE